MQKLFYFYSSTSHWKYSNAGPYWKREISRPSEKFVYFRRFIKWKSQFCTSGTVTTKFLKTPKKKFIKNGGYCEGPLATLYFFCILIKSMNNCEKNAKRFNREIGWFSAARRFQLSSNSGARIEGSIGCCLQLQLYPHDGFSKRMSVLFRQNAHESGSIDSEALPKFGSKRHVPKS